MKLRWIKAIFCKISCNLIKKLDQKKKIREKRNIFDSIIALYECQESTLNAFKKEYFEQK